MIRILWLATLLLALAWTAGAWALSSFTQWLLSLPASAELPALVQSVSGWQTPGWLALWSELDDTDVQAAREFALWGLNLLQAPPPALQAMLPWAVPTLWLAWGLGLALLLVLAAVLQWALRRLRQPARDAASRLAALATTRRAGRVPAPPPTA
jgi:hypothetical protein